MHKKGTLMSKLSIENQCKAACEAWPSLAKASAHVRNNALKAMAQALIDNQEVILKANGEDQKSGRAAGLSESLIDRLSLNPARVKGLADSILMIESLADPLGEVLGGWTRPNGLMISKVRVPLGVLGMIYEARPNVTADAAALAIKTGNAVVLRGSSTAYQSNLAITNCLKKAIEKAGLNPNVVQLLDDTTHEGVNHFVTLKQYLSVVIPRGGAGLIQSVISTSQVPTIETGVGNCHIVVDDSADVNQALSIIENAKVQRPSVCNSCETVLVHKNIASTFLPMLQKHLTSKGVELRGCTETEKIITCTPAQTADWETEFLDLILAVKVVNDIPEAVQHIAHYGTKHSESLLSNNRQNITYFKQNVDAAVVLINASTRFVDGGEFGFGAELGISTQKLHARGPMGLAELTTYTYIVEGDGHIRA
jgi:glutamate-5-semialdehyde dehydrogenase